MCIAKDATTVPTRLINPGDFAQREVAKQAKQASARMQELEDLLQERENAQTLMAAELEEKNKTIDRLMTQVCACIIVYLHSF